MKRRNIEHPFHNVVLFQELQERVASLEELSVSLQCAMESSSASVGGCSTINPAHQQSSPWQTSSKAPVTSGNGAAINYSQVVQVRILHVSIIHDNLDQDT